ncbi:MULTISPECIES: ATP-binding protein [unclassified Petrotoga]|uniref:ATP-binding protein n=1 Tax=unclassified Petrotoga TaxID=2620614 RepID=UPI000CC800DE|nr:MULTISPECIES: ATP-binding protein [unclassified Petrotoga]PNR94046.1 histidine kinase [Petrotoga sp. HWHPT.55.6.3]
MVSKILNIIYNDKPQNVLKSTFKEVSSQLKESMEKDNIMFIYQSSREVFKALASTIDKFENIKIYLRGDEDLKNKIFSNEIVPVNLKDDISQVSSTANDIRELFLYPIFSEEGLIGAVGLFDNQIDKNTFDQHFFYYSVLINLIIEKLRIRDLQDKVILMEKLTDIIEEITEKDIIVNNVLKLLKDSLHAESIAFWKLQGDTLEIKYFLGIDESTIITRTIPIENTLEGKAIKERSSYMLVGRENFQNYFIPFNIDLKSSIYSVIEQNDEVYGVLSVYNREAEYSFRTYKNFDDADFHVFSDTAKRLAFSIHRINLYNKLQNEVSKLTELKMNYEQLIEKQKEHLDMLNALDKISQAVRSVYDKNLAIKIMLLGLTSGRGLKFNRALYLEKDKVRGFLVPKIWVGPDTEEDATEIWKDANIRALKYGNVVQYLKEEAIKIPTNNKLILSLQNKVLAYKGHPILERVVEKKQVLHIVPQMLEIKWEDLEDIYDIVKINEFLIFPVTGMTETKGVVIVDNKINKKPITNIETEIVKLFKDNMGLALEMIENYQELKEKTLRLEEQKDLMDYYRRFKDNILQNLAVAVVVVDRNGKINEWNRMAENFFSRPRETMIGTAIQDITELIGEEIIEKIKDIYETRNNIKLKNYEVKLSDTKKIFDIQLSPLRNEELGVIEGVIIVFDDVTELYNLQKEMEKRERLAAMGEMTARIAHEVRNPITIIGGFLNRIAKMNEMDDIQKYTQIIKEELSRLEHIVNEILEYSRGGKINQIEEVDLIEIIRGIILMYEDFIQQKHVMVNTDWLKEEIVIKADKDKIKQVLMNLIKNALENVYNNGKIEIKVGFTDENKVFFEITNDGPSIPQEIKEKLFTPFLTTKSNGTGLGLAICKKIIEEEHKGKIYLVKSDNNGTSFRFEIPTGEK